MGRTPVSGTLLASQAADTEAGRVELLSSAAAEDTVAVKVPRPAPEAIGQSRAARVLLPEQAAVVELMDPEMVAQVAAGSAHLVGAEDTSRSRDLLEECVHAHMGSDSTN